MNDVTPIIQLIQPERHVVLVAPEIHWNTGNIGRTCLAANACLHLVKPLGFSLHSRELKRAGLDYWERVRPRVWESFDALAEGMRPADLEMAMFTKTGARPFWAMPSFPRMFLVFGSETRGLPRALLARYAASTYHIPITDRTRSLNLSTAAGIALYESLRHNPPRHAWGQPSKKLDFA
jgi:tRNA (cytidine/uridine-2'-O-)-methyltransferase